MGTLLEYGHSMGVILRCPGCDEEIPFERLKVIPWARRIVDAASPGAAALRAEDEGQRLADHNDRYAG